MKKLLKHSATFATGKRILSVLVVLTTLILSGQAQINGVVLDQTSNEPLIGVNVSLNSNSAVGTITDIDGNFEINASSGDSILFTYVGYNDNIIPATEGGMTVYMSEASELLSEIVVIGYGAVKKEDLTGVVTKIGEDDFIQGSIASPEKLLNGKVAGLQVSNNGEPGGGTRLRLRGGTSLDASTAPLIVIDGVPLDSRTFVSGRNPLNFINAADVESLTVLKDASAAAIYGSRGANGVIIVTTKSGKKGGLKIGYKGNVNVSQFSGSPKHLSFQNFNAAINAKAPQEIEFLGSAQTDWLEEITQSARSQEHNLSLSGGTDKFKYLVSGGLLKSNGVLLTSSHEKKSIAGKFSTSLFDDNLSISFHTRTGVTNDRFAPNVMGAALGFDPTRPVLDSTSQFNGYFQWKDVLATANPVSTLLLTENTGETQRNLNNLTVTYNLPFIKGLSLTSNVSYDHTTGTKREFNNPLDKGNFVDEGKLFNEDLRNYSALIETYGTYKRDLGSSENSLTFTAGHSWQEFDQENRWNEGRFLVEESEGWMSTDTVDRRDSFLVTNRLISFFGRTNLTLKNKYLITASLRADGSSRFGSENQWGLFPSVAFAWRVLEEDFTGGLSNIFSDLKLRLGWGVTGNEDIPDFLFKTFYSYGSLDSRYQFGDDYIRTLRGTGVDPGIKWEETTAYNIGFDYGFNNNRISGSLDLYQKYTNDLLFTVAAPAFTNLKDRILTNIGKMENKGLELSLNSVIYDGQSFDWNLGFNVSYNKNEITKLDNADLKGQIADILSQDPNAYVPDFLGGYEAGGISGDVGQTIQFLREGQSIETFLTYESLVDSNGKLLNDSEDHNGDGFIDNLDIYRDFNGDGLINEDDLVLGRTAAPTFMYGITSSWNYKGWDLSTVIRAHTGNYVYNNVSSSTGYFDRLTDRVTNNIHESAFTTDFKKRQLKSDYYIEKADFIKIDNITLGYSMNDLSVFRSLRLYATVSNVLTLTGYSGLDPELPQFSNGIDNNLYPISRNFLLGLNANF